MLRLRDEKMKRTKKQTQQQATQTQIRNESQLLSIIIILRICVYLFCRMKYGVVLDQLLNDPRNYNLILMYDA